MGDVDLLMGGTRSATPQQISALNQRIAEYVDTEAEIKTAEAMLENAKARRNELKHRTLPEAMLAANMRTIETEDGTKVRLSFMTDGSLGHENREAKLDAIVEFGGGEIVKQMLVIEFPKEFVDHAEELRARIAKMFETTKKWGKIPAQIRRERNVNHQTMCAWIKERMASDDVRHQLPQAFFDRTGLWYGEGAKVKLPKKDQ